MIGLILTLHVVVCFALIAIILFQVGRGAGLANIFGGGSSGLFTPSSGGFLSKLTAVLAALFLISSLYLSLSAKGRLSRSIVEKALNEEEPITPVEKPLQK